jgi:membrane protease YdiL (CAAX protease family)
MNNSIKPLPFRKSLLYFGIPALFVLFIVYIVMPLLAERGVPIFWNYLLAFATAPMFALIAASVIGYRREGNIVSWSGLTKRFRFNRMDGKTWLWAIGLTVFMVASVGLLSFTSRWLVSSDLITFPDYWPSELKPVDPGSLTGASVPTEFMGLSLAGNWWILLVLLVSLVIATFGEEIWWRGYILPRQELVHGNRTWLIHGLLWTAFHIFTPWNLLAILPGSLALSFVAQRLKNTWPAVIAHGLANGLLVVIIVVLGIAA